MEMSWQAMAFWGGFIAFVVVMLTLDLMVFHRKEHVVSMKEALAWTAFWVCLALTFNALIFLFWNSFFAPVGGEGSLDLSNRQAGMAFLAGYLVEESLSVDNIFVILMIFSYFHVPRELQHRVLFYGILGAMVFRLTFILIGSAILKQFLWTMIIFGLFLMLTGFKMLLHGEKKIDMERNLAVRLLKRMMPIDHEFHGRKFFIIRDGRRWATPLFVALLTVEFADIIFAIDSIPAIFAITDNPFIVFTSNVFAILGLRSLFFAVDGLVRLFHYLKYALSAILIFVGGKMIYNFVQHEMEELPKLPISVSLLIILGILVLSVLASVFFPPKVQEHEIPEEVKRTE